MIIFQAFTETFALTSIGAFSANRLAQSKTRLTQDCDVKTIAEIFQTRRVRMRVELFLYCITHALYYMV
jgi:hypothetical protein